MMANQSLPLDELESLLRSAHEKVMRPANDPQDDLLGPGDVQYLRGESSTLPRQFHGDDRLPPWPPTTSVPDQLLQQAEQRLADAILDSNQAQSTENLNVTSITLNQVSPSASAIHRQGLTLEDLGDVELDISIELGRAEILIEDVLKLREGSVVSLDKLAGDPVDIVANGRLVARGELLVIDGKFGVRLSEVL